MTRLTECIAPNFYEFHETLKEGNYTECWLKGGRGSTKSTVVSMEILLGMMSNPEANAVVFRRFENEIRDTVYGQIQWSVNKLDVADQWRFYVAPFKAVYEPTGQMIVFKGADNPKKIKSIKLAKGYLKYAWFEEVDQFGGMSEIRDLLQSIQRGTNAAQTSFFSYNPPKSARSWTNAETRVVKKGRIVHRSNYLGVPEDWLGRTFLLSAEHLKNTNPEAYNHEYLGKEVGTGLEVFNNVTIRPISTGELDYFDNFQQGLDFGYALDPLAFIQIHFDSKNNKIYLVDEISGIKMSNRQFSSKLSADQRLDITWADGTEPKSIDELRQDYGMNVSAAERIRGSVDHGVKYLQGLSEIVIDSQRCPLAAKEFVNYALDSRRDGSVISKYPDKDNHTIDATRYALSRLILKARKSARKGKIYKPMPVLSRWR